MIERYNSVRVYAITSTEYYVQFYSDYFRTPVGKPIRAEDVTYPLVQNTPGLRLGYTVNGTEYYADVSFNEIVRSPGFGLAPKHVRKFKLFNRTITIARD